MEKRIHKTMTGRVIDMESLLAQNETMPAVGNAKMNARGDELGAGGKIVRRREDIVGEYYEDNPKATPQEAPPVATPVAKQVPPAQEKAPKNKVQESKTNG